MEDCGHIPVWAGERVERTNARGRHSYCPPFKAWMVEQALKPGMSTAGLAMRNQVNANQLRRWVQLYRASAATVLMPRLLPVMVAPEQGSVAARTPTHGIEIEVAGTVVRVREGVDSRTLRVVLDALREQPR
jgi:transposase-like protein